MTAATSPRTRHPRRRSAIALAALAGLAATASSAVAAPPWSPLQLVPGSTSLNDLTGPETSFAGSRDGSAVVAYLRRDGRVAASYRQAGGTWSPARILSATHAEGLQAGMDDAGQPVILWTRRGPRAHSGPVEVATRSRTTGRLGGTHRIATAQSAALAVSRNGEALVALRVAAGAGRSVARLGTLTPGTRRLPTTRILSRPTESVDLVRIHLGPNGAAAVTWDGARLGNAPALGLRASVRPGTGAQFGAPETIAGSTATSVALGGGGRLGMLQRSLDGTRWFLTAGHRPPGGPPETPTRLSLEPGATGAATGVQGVTSPRIAFNRRGDAAAVWIGEVVEPTIDGPAGRYVPQASYRRANGTGWTPAQDLDAIVEDNTIDERNHFSLDRIGVSVQPLGAAVVVWSLGGQVKASIRPVGAGAFPAAVTLGSSVGGPFTVADAGGATVAAWGSRHDGGTVTAAVLRGTRAFLPAETIGTAPFRQIGVGAAGPNLAVVVGPSAEHLASSPRQIRVALRQPLG